MRRAWIKAGILEHSTDKFWMCAGFTLSTELAPKAHETKAKRSFEEMVPEEYRKYTKVFSEAKSQRLPEHQPWDHTIDLKEGASETILKGLRSSLSLTFVGDTTTCGSRKETDGRLRL